MMDTPIGDWSDVQLKHTQNVNVNLIGNDNNSDDEKSISYVSTSSEIGNMDTSDHNIKWKKYILQYLFSIYITEFMFGQEQNGKYSLLIYAFGFMHFAFELQITYYLFFTKIRTIKLISTITFILFAVQIIFMFITNYEVIRFIFKAEFLFSDLTSFTVSVYILFNLSESTPHYEIICRICFGIAIHFIGPLWASIALYLRWFKDNTYSTGMGWISIAICSLIQVIIFKPIFTQNDYQIPPNPLSMKRRQQIMLWLLMHIIVACNGYLSLVRSTKYEHEIEDRYGTALEAKIICIFAPMFGIVGVIVSIYWYHFEPKLKQNNDE